MDFVPGREGHNQASEEPSRNIHGQLRTSDAPQPVIDMHGTDTRHTSVTSLSMRSTSIRRIQTARYKTQRTASHVRRHCSLMSSGKRDQSRFDGPSAIKGILGKRESRKIYSALPNVEWSDDSGEYKYGEDEVPGSPVPVDIDDDEDDDAVSSRNSLVVEQRLVRSRFTSEYSYPEDRKSPSFPKSQQSLLHNIDGLLKPETDDAETLVWNSFIHQCKKAFLMLTYILVPGTFGYGPKAATASAVATVTAFILWIAVLVTAVGSIVVFIHVGRVSNLFTMVSVNSQLEGPSLAFCPVSQPHTFQFESVHADNLQNRTVRIRLNHGDEHSTVHTTTGKCYRESLAHCGCVYVWTLEFWKRSNPFVKSRTANLPFLYASTWEEPHRSDDTLSVLIDLHPSRSSVSGGVDEAAFSEETNSSAIVMKNAHQKLLKLRRVPKTVRVGLFSSVAVKNKDSPAWMPIEIGSSTAGFLTLERFWEININRASLLYFMLAVHEHRVFRFETITLPTTDLSRYDELQHHYRLANEQVYLVSAVNQKVSDELYKLLRGMLHYKHQDNALLNKLDSKATKKGLNYPIPEFNRSELRFNWSSPHVTELHFEFRSFFTTESFRVGHRMNFIRVWGVIMSILASLNYLDLFYAVFPRYRGRHPRLAVSKFVRIATCGAARDNHSTEKIPVPGN